MRAFLALVPPADAVAAYAEALPGWRAAWPDLGWVAPERWHVTLAFLGEVSEGQTRRLALPDALAPATLALAGGGCFPDPARPRVVWAGLTGDVDAVGALARTCRAAARAVGLELERRPFRAHLTLARVRRPRPLDDLVAALAPLSGPAWTATEVVLLRSHLGPTPRYEPVRAWPLGYQA